MRREDHSAGSEQDLTRMGRQERSQDQTGLRKAKLGTAAGTALATERMGE